MNRDWLFSKSTPAVILAAVAQNTQRIKLTSATTVLSKVEPVLIIVGKLQSERN